MKRGACEIGGEMENSRYASLCALSQECNGDLFVCQKDSVFSSRRILFLSRMCAHAECSAVKNNGDFTFYITAVKVFTMGQYHFPRNSLAGNASNGMSLRIVA